MSELVVAYAKADTASANLIVAKLEKRGFKVTRSPGRARPQAHRLNGAAAKAPPLLVLWSRDYAEDASPATLKGARVAVRLDAAPPAPLLKAPAIDLRTWRGREDHRGWRKLVTSLVARPPLPGKRAAKGATMTSDKTGKTIDLSAYEGQGNTLTGTLVWGGVLVALIGGLWFAYKAFVGG